MSVPHPQLLRMIEGAVHNAFDAHPRWSIAQTHRNVFARSVAKRAAGTVAAAMPQLLAAKPSGRDEFLRIQSPSHRRGCVRAAPRRGASVQRRRSPLARHLQKELSRLIAPAKADGQQERVATLVEILRFVAAYERTR